MVDPNLTGLVCILDTVLLTETQQDKRTEVKTRAKSYHDNTSDFIRRKNVTVNKMLLWHFLSMDRPEENFTW